MSATAAVWGQESGFQDQASGKFEFTVSAAFWDENTGRVCLLCTLILAFGNGQVPFEKTFFEVDGFTGVHVSRQEVLQLGFEDLLERFKV